MQNLSSLGLRAFFSTALLALLLAASPASAQGDTAVFKFAFGMTVKQIPYKKALPSASCKRHLYQLRYVAEGWDEVTGSRGRRIAKPRAWPFMRPIRKLFKVKNFKLTIGEGEISVCAGFYKGRLFRLVLELTGRERAWPAVRQEARRIYGEPTLEQEGQQAGTTTMRRIEAWILEGDSSAVDMRFSEKSAFARFTHLKEQIELMDAVIEAQGDS
ncbi:MAG TPA: hypothetical protein QF861_09325 [Alphaproteobacteria bacterium]|jgi:hypothetical protein|nr:hypothetical protein [Alphaproteobacteria bacterium]